MIATAILLAAVAIRFLWWFFSDMATETKRHQDERVRHWNHQWAVALEQNEKMKRALTTGSAAVHEYYAVPGRPMSPESLYKHQDNFATQKVAVILVPIESAGYEAFP